MLPSSFIVTFSACRLPGESEGYVKVKDDMGIIQSALTNRGLRLELRYREPAMIRSSSIRGEQTLSVSAPESVRFIG